MWFNLAVVVILIALAGTFAGLTLALFGIRLTTLERKMRLGDVRVRKIYKIRKKGNLLLCTLLLGNVTSYTIMAIFLGSITSGVIAGFVATALIFVFGEILPQAIFPRYALEIGARLHWVVWIFIVLLYPVAAPMAWLLDKLLGHEPPVLWNREELREIIRFHEDVGDGIIDRDEERIILGALAFSERTVVDIMIPGEDVFFLYAQAKINDQTLTEIKSRGFNRIPVIDETSGSISGILYSSDLIGIDPDEAWTVASLCTKKNLILVQESLKLDDLLNLLVSHKMHMAIVVNKDLHFTGIVTMEDIMEEILDTELEDRKNLRF